MRKVLLGMAGLVVIGLMATTAFADDGDTSPAFTLDLNKLFGSTFQEEDKAKVTCGGWGQMRYEYSDGTYTTYPPADPRKPRPTGGNETFRVLRFRFLPKVVYKWLSFGCQFETDSTLTLLDFWANIVCPKFEGKVQLKMGQFIPPFGLQRPISPYKIRTINYSKVVTYLFGDGDPIWSTWGNLRDKGLMVHGTVKFGEKTEDFQPNLYYALGLFQGEAANVDANSDPAWTTFVTAKVEAMKGILFGLSYEDGSRQWVDGTIPINRNVNRDRFGACWEITLADLMVYGEYIVGNMNPADMDKHDDEISPATYFHLKKMNVDGWYLVVGYFVMPKKLQLLFKVDIVDLPAWSGNIESRDNEHDIPYTKERMYGLGFNWLINKHCKLLFMWEQEQDEGRGKATRIAGSEHRAYVLFGVNF